MTIRLMRNLRISPLLLMAATLMLLLLAFGGALASSPSVRVAPDSYEGIAINGSQASALIGADVNDLFVFVYHAATTTWAIIPFQVDEVDATGYYTTTDEIPTFDANDEIAFMVGDLGDQAPAWTWLLTSDRLTLPRVEVKVADPANPANAAYAYIVRSQDALALAPADYVAYVTADKTFDTPAYLAGLSPLASGSSGWHPGLEKLRIKNYTPSPQDILDRTHLRIGIKPRFLGFCLPTQYLCEEDLAQYLPPDFDLTPTKDGAVRVVGGGPLTPTLIYRDSLYVSSSLDLATLAGDPNVCSIAYMRVTFDLRDPNLSAFAPATYYDATGSTDPVNGVAPGTAIGGAPRSWVQYSGSQGSIVVLDSLTAAGGAAAHYYRDNSSAGSCTEGADPGSSGSYGESGTEITNPTGLLSIVFSGVIQPPAAGPIGAPIRSNLDNPLQETASAQYLCSVADLDGNHVVDVVGDIGPAAAAWSCQSGDACYLPAADTNQDGAVDIDDVQLVSACFGWALP